jgi:hypothetical protein
MLRSAEEARNDSDCEPGWIIGGYQHNRCSNEQNQKQNKEGSERDNVPQIELEYKKHSRWWIQPYTLVAILHNTQHVVAHSSVQCNAYWQGERTK